MNLRGVLFYLIIFFDKNQILALCFDKIFHAFSEFRFILSQKTGIYTAKRGACGNFYAKQKQTETKLSFRLLFFLKKTIAI